MLPLPFTIQEKTHTNLFLASYIINFIIWTVSESLGLLEFHDGVQSGRWLCGFKSHRLITWPQFLPLHPFKPSNTQKQWLAKIMG